MTQRNSSHNFLKTRGHQQTTYEEPAKYTFNRMILIRYTFVIFTEARTHFLSLDNSRGKT